MDEENNQLTISLKTLLFSALLCFMNVSGTLNSFCFNSRETVMKRPSKH